MEMAAFSTSATIYPTVSYLVSSFKTRASVQDRLIIFPTLPSVWHLGILFFFLSCGTPENILANVTCFLDSGLL